MRGLTRKVLPVIFLLVSMLAGKLASAQTDKIEGTWFNQKKDAKIQIYKATDGKFYGKIIWLKDPIEDGKPKMDKKNPKENLRSQPLVQMVIMKGFELDGNTYEDGTIYDPESGKTYDCKMSFKGSTLAVRGYIGFSLFGRTEIWQRASS